MSNINTAVLINRRPKANQHLVALVHFEKGTEDGACDCRCGWSGQASEFTDHRRSQGFKRQPGMIGVPDMLRGDSSVWTRKCKVPSCDRDAGKAKGYCAGHYDRARMGRPLDTPLGPARGKSSVGRAGYAGVGK